MENKLNAGPSMPKVRVEDIPMFGKLLSRSRSALGKTPPQMVSELSLGSVSPIVQWEQGSSFPTEDKLPAISKAYGIDLTELTRVFKVSKAAREIEKNARKR